MNKNEIENKKKELAEEYKELILGTEGDGRIWHMSDITKDYDLLRWPNEYLFVRKKGTNDLARLTLLEPDFFHNLYKIN